MKLLALLIFLFGCGGDGPKLAPYSKYKLSSGEVVECRYENYYAIGCGAHIHDCTNGGDYRCQTNFQRQ